MRAGRTVPGVAFLPLVVSVYPEHRRQFIGNIVEEKCIEVVINYETFAQLAKNYQQTLCGAARKSVFDFFQ